MLPDIILAELETYSVRYLNAKQMIGIEKEKQTKAAAEITNRIPIGDKTQRTETLPSSGKKIVVKGGFTTKVDVDGIEALFRDDPDLNEMPNPITSVTTLALDAKGYEWYKVNHPKLFAKIAQFVTLKPKTLSVSVQPPKKG